MHKGTTIETTSVSLVPEHEQGQGAGQALAREVAYELIPFSQRRLLHAAMAEAQEGLLRSHRTAAALAEAAARCAAPQADNGDYM